MKDKDIVFLCRQVGDGYEITDQIKIRKEDKDKFSNKFEKERMPGSKEFLIFEPLETEWI